jgi:alpha-L-rhamnosidase
MEGPEMDVKATCLKTESLYQPLGIDNAHPEFSWMLEGAAQDSQQAAYEIQVSKDEKFGDLVWSTGRVESASQFSVQYQGLPLASCQRYFWRVQAWLDGGESSGWSDTNWFETAYLDSGLLQAGWIGFAGHRAEDHTSTMYLRHSADVKAQVVKARAYVSALGWYRLFVNENDVTGNALVPRWTPLDHVVEYQTYDVTAAFKSGKNKIAMVIGDGRYRGQLGVTTRREVYGSQLAGFARIELELADGTRQVIRTDDQWEAGFGPIITSDPQSGEVVDLRIADGGLLDSSRFGPVAYLPPTARELIAEQTGRVEEIARLKPVSIKRAPSGKQIVDFGQNFAGVVSILLSGKSGQVVQLTHSELLKKDGELDIEYLKLPLTPNVLQRDVVTLSSEEVRYQPWFTIHGFRYLEVEGLDYDLKPEHVEGVVLSSNIQQNGVFECSDERLNQLHQNVMWSLRSNFVDTPTDCPTRERSGWTGDIQIFANTALMMVDAKSYLHRYLRNLTLEQEPNGRIPPFIPSEASAYSGGKKNIIFRMSSAAGWGDVTVLLPWSLYQYQGDTAVLARQYPTMQRWVESLRKLALKKGRSRWFSKRDAEHDQYIVDGGFHWGEWLRPGDGLPKIIKAVIVPEARVATAYLCNSARLLSKIASLLGRDADAKLYLELSQKVRAAWRATFIDATGRIGNDRQDDYVRALAFGLLEPAEEAGAVARLVDRIAAKGYHLETGFLSTPMLLPTLVKHGRSDVAYRLLLQTTVPSWLGQIALGATTVWETWEGYKPNGQATMSHNHYAFGTVAGWLYEAVAGISPAEPGYKKIRIAPCIGGGLTHASASVLTPYGRASTSWAVKDGNVHLEIEVPVGSRAEVLLGDGSVQEVGSGMHSFAWTQFGEAKKPALSAV